MFILLRKGEGMMKNVHRVVGLPTALFFISGLAVWVLWGDALVYTVEGNNGKVVTG